MVRAQPATATVATDTEADCAKRIMSFEILKSGK